MKSVLLVDGYSFVREALRSAIDSDALMHVKAQARDRHEALEWLDREQFDLIVIDISNPERTGLETLCDIHQRQPQIPIVIVNGMEQPHHALNYIKLGCSSYLPRQADMNRILKAIKLALAGQQQPLPVSETSSTDGLAKDSVARPDKMLHEYLSVRELQVFLKLAVGKSISVVANELNVTNSSVSVFRSKILRKMHFNSNAELILYAIHHHLIFTPG